MKTPPFLIGSALIYWGWQTGFLITAVIAAFIVELHHLTSWRLKLDDNSFSNVITLCNIVLVAAVIFSYAWEGKAGSLLKVLSWFPLILLPIVLAQFYSTAGGINPDVFFIFLKKNRKKRNNAFLINIAYPYLAICLLSASVANVRTLITYVLMAFICGWALYWAKPSKSSLMTWLTLFFVVAGAGYYGGVGLHSLHKKAEERFIEWYAGTFIESNAYQQTTTSMGQVGKRKTSGEIIFRVKKGEEKSGAFHLIESSYDTFRSPSWFAVKAPMKPLKRDDKKSTWKLSHENAGSPKFTIFKSLQGGKNILPLPLNTTFIENLPVDELFQNRMGTVMSEHDSLFVAFNVTNSKETTKKDEPTEKDLLIPKGYTSLINKVTKEINLNLKNSDQVVSSLTGYFLSNFTYSLDVEKSKEASRPLKDFLLKSKSGHCEYFATATTLLLRSAGIPARYTVGYLVHEYSGLEDMYVVRERDAHAWVTAYVNGKWQTVDTTPPSWVTADGQSASIMEPLADLRAYLQFIIEKWRASGENIFVNYWYLFLVLIALLLWRLFGKDDVSIVKKKKEAIPQDEAEQMDSPFYKVEKELKSLGYNRHEWESYPAWFGRLAKEGKQVPSFNSLNKALSIHTRMRFDPAGISGSEKDELEQLVKGWMTQQIKNQPQNGCTEI